MDASDYKGLKSEMTDNNKFRGFMDQETSDNMCNACQSTESL